MGVNDGTLQALARQIGLALGLLEDELTRSGLQGLLAKLGLRRVRGRRARPAGGRVGNSGRG